MRLRRPEAARLITTATHESLKEQVRLANRDLDEAVLWLQKPDIDRRPSILAIVDTILSLSSWRLRMVAKSIETYGPDAELVGY